MSIEARIMERVNLADQPLAVTQKREELQRLAVLARQDKHQYLNLFKSVGIEENATIAATDIKVGSVPTNLHGLSANRNEYTSRNPRSEKDPFGLDGSLEGTLAHCAAFASNEAAIALTADLYELYKGRSAFMDEELRQNDTVTLAGLKDGSGRTVFHIAYMIHKDIGDFVDAHSGFSKFLSKLNLR